MKKLADIDKNKSYTGYYWLSDATTPIVLNNSPVDLTEYEHSNPFIQEAYFTDGNISYSIKHFDGKGHIVSEVVLKDLVDQTAHAYIADPAIIRAGNSQGITINKLKFIQEWTAKADALCDNMKVLTPARIAFIGFEAKGENSND